MIALIDYGSGNLRSVQKALRALDAPVSLVASRAELEGKEAVVLPGVGHFGDCVTKLRSSGLWDPLADWLAAERPFLGICVGYQMLFEGSEEAPGEEGFGFFRGRVRRFSERGLKIPQIGWNKLRIQDRNHWMWRGLPDEPFVYFVHSYFPEPADPSVIGAMSEYADSFAASAVRGLVAGTQFHPEKSQSVGLKILGNFLDEARVSRAEGAG